MAMTLNEGKKTLRNMLGLALADFGFSEEKELVYTKPHGDGAVWKLTFPCRLDQNKSLKVSCFVGVSYYEVESLLRPENLEAGEVIATIMKPIHTLRCDDQFREWTLKDAESQEVIGNEIIADINSVAIPFWDKYSSLKEVKSDLEKNDPSHWFILSPEQRVATLAAIVFTQGDKQKSLKLLDDAIQERADAHPKKNRLLKEIHKNILAT